MTIDATKPTDDVLVSDIPAYIREGRTELNTAQIMTTSQVEVNVSSPAITANGGLDVIRLLAPYAQNVQTISGGTEGDVMLLIMLTSYVTFIDGSGNINLKGDPAAPDFPTQVGDMLMLTYRGSAWEEVFRTLA